MSATVPLERAERRVRAMSAFCNTVTGDQKHLKKDIQTKTQMRVHKTNGETLGQGISRGGRVVSCSKQKECGRKRTG